MLYLCFPADVNVFEQDWHLIIPFSRASKEESHLVLLGCDGVSLVL